MWVRNAQPNSFANIEAKNFPICLIALPQHCYHVLTAHELHSISPPLQSLLIMKDPWTHEHMKKKLSWSELMIVKELRTKNLSKEMRTRILTEILRLQS
jgi:hypothetical protein